ncbi:hypothetical protein KI387_020366, partial [Taxus chinensis]
YDNDRHAGIFKTTAHNRQVEGVYHFGKDHEEAPCMCQQNMDEVKVGRASLAKYEEISTMLHSEKEDEQVKENPSYDIENYISVFRSLPISFPYLCHHGQLVEKNEPMSSFMFYSIMGGHHGQHSAHNTDLVLGVLWLHSLGKFTQDYQIIELRLKLDGQEVMLPSMTHEIPQVDRAKRRGRTSERRQDIWATHNEALRGSAPIKVEVKFINFVFEIEWDGCYLVIPNVIMQLGFGGMIGSNKRLDWWLLKHVAINVCTIVIDIPNLPNILFSATQKRTAMRRDSFRSLRAFSFKNDSFVGPTTLNPQCSSTLVDMDGTKNKDATLRHGLVCQDVDYLLISWFMIEITSVWKDFHTAEYTKEEVVTVVFEVEDEGRFNEGRGSGCLSLFGQKILQLTDTGSRLWEYYNMFLHLGMMAFGHESLQLFEGKQFREGRTMIELMDVAKWNELTLWDVEQN